MMKKVMMSDESVSECVFFYTAIHTYIYRSYIALDLGYMQLPTLSVYRSYRPCNLFLVGPSRPSLSDTVELVLTSTPSISEYPKKWELDRFPSGEGVKALCGVVSMIVGP